MSGKDVPEGLHNEPGIDFTLLAVTLNHGGTLYQNLQDMVGHVTTRMIDHEEGDSEYPSPHELFLREQLIDAGVFDVDTSTDLTLILTQASQQFYIRINAETITQVEFSRLLRIEAALNSLVFADRWMEDYETASVQDLYAFQEAFAKGLNVQIMPPWNKDEARGEWITRERFAVFAERIQTPLRTNIDFRVNTSAGWLAAEVYLPPVSTQPTRWYSFTEGRVKDHDEAQRIRRAHDMYARVCILVAQAAFSTSPAIQHVCLAGIVKENGAQTCFLSGKIDRSVFTDLAFDHLIRPMQAWRCVGGELKVSDGRLQPIKQTFRLEEPRFCPPSRYRTVELSDRELTRDHAEALGAGRLSDLGIYEEYAREEAASMLARAWKPSFEENVRQILEAADQTKRHDVRSAALRTAKQLATGSLDDNPEEFVESFVNGDDLTREVRRAVTLFRQGQTDEPLRILEAAVFDSEMRGRYLDSREEVWRSFDNYVERALFNRTYACILPRDTQVRLAPDSYKSALHYLGLLYANVRDNEHSLACSRRALELDPFFHPAYVSCVHACRRSRQIDDAIRYCDESLAHAYTLTAAAVSYIIRAELAMNDELELSLASACLAIAGSYPGPHNDRVQDLCDEIAGYGVEPVKEPTSVLARHGVPLAPSNGIRDILVDCSKASVDAEVFPVASQLTYALSRLTGNDILFGVSNSIEGLPDY